MSDTPNTDERTYPADAMGKTLVVHAEWAKHLERENAEIKVRCESLRQSHEKQIAALERENAELRADKDRLDWLGSVKCAYYHEGPCCWRINEDETTDGETIREAIDAARKEKP